MSEKVDKKGRIDVDTTSSELKGLAGFFESVLRKFRMASYLIALVPLYFLCLLAMGISATPGVYLFFLLSEKTLDWLPFFHYLSLGFGIVTGYFLYGITMLFVIPLFNFLMPFRVKPFRGPYYSLTSVPWYIHNAFTYVVRYTFLEFVTPTPLNILFYKMMGMKIGKGVHINTTNISDPALIELEDKVTIGGSATLIAHYASHGFLIVERVKIGKGTTIGIKATIMGDVEIGKGAIIAPHEVIYPKSRIPDGRRNNEGQE
jgi:hypothetical protein